MRNANSVTFTGAINQAAADLGRAPTPEQVERLNLELQSLAVIDDETGTVSVPLDAGAPLAIDKFLARAAAKFPAVAASPAAPGASGWVPVRIGSSTGYRKADDPILRILNGIQTGQATDTAREAATWPNPWAKGAENRTRQAILTNTDPARAARLKAEAGIRT